MPTVFSHLFTCLIKSCLFSLLNPQFTLASCSVSLFDGSELASPCWWESREFQSCLFRLLSWRCCYRTATGDCTPQLCHRWSAAIAPAHVHHAASVNQPHLLDSSTTKTVFSPADGGCDKCPFSWTDFGVTREMFFKEPAFLDLFAIYWEKHAEFVKETVNCRWLFPLGYPKHNSSLRVCKFTTNMAAQSASLGHNSWKQQEN